MTNIRSLMIIQWKWEIDLRDSTDRVPDELWTEVCDIVQETASKTTPKKNAKKQNACLRRP